MVRLPDFLVIGAMKCGTTTLFRDLETHPGIFMPDDKEPHALVDDEVLTPTGQARYAALFKPARDDQLAGEASTGYTKIPWKTGAVERAQNVLRPDLKLIYIVRHPIARIVSHHYHQHAAGRTGADIAEAIAADERLLGYTRYATQLKPWLDAYGPELVRVIKFEDFIADRGGTMRTVFAWMGLDPALARPDEGASYNKSEGKQVAAGPLRDVLKSGVYQRYGRRLTPRWVKNAARAALFRGAPARPAPPSQDLVDRLTDELWPEVEKLSELLGLSEPMWTSESFRARFVEPRPAAEVNDEKGRGA